MDCIKVFLLVATVAGGNFAVAVAVAAAAAIAGVVDVARALYNLTTFFDF